MSQANNPRTITHERKARRLPKDSLKQSGKDIEREIWKMENGITECLGEKNKSHGKEL